MRLVIWNVNGSQRSVAQTEMQLRRLFDRQPDVTALRALGGGQLERLIGREAVDLAAVNPPLLEPACDRRLAHPGGRRSWATRVPDRASSITCMRVSDPYLAGIWSSILPEDSRNATLSKQR